MNELIQLRGNNAVVSSLDVAEHFGKKHQDVLRKIENAISNSENAKLRFQKSIYKSPDNNKSYPMYYMNRDGFSFLVMGFTGAKADEWKWKYIDAFNEMERLLTEKQTQAWVETRQQSKLTRKAETDVLKRFVEYAQTQGSGNADKYYIIFSNLANKVVNIKERDNATTFQLNSLTYIESIILHTVECQMKLGTEYHEIYQLCKKAIDEFKEITAFDQLAIEDRKAQ